VPRPLRADRAHPDDGDRILDVPLAQVGGKALFVKEIEEALLAGRVDLAVHSMKDVPTDLPEGLTIAAIPQREDPADVLISPEGRRLADLPRGARVGTSSLRRQSQLLQHRPDLVVVGLREILTRGFGSLAAKGWMRSCWRRPGEEARPRPAGDGGAPARRRPAGGRPGGAGIEIREPQGGRGAGGREAGRAAKAVWRSS